MSATTDARIAADDASPTMFQARKEFMDKTFRGLVRVDYGVAAADCEFEVEYRVVGDDRCAPGDLV